MNEQNTRATIADAAAIIINDAIRVTGDTGQEPAILAVLSAMIERDAPIEEYAHLVHALAAVGTLAIVSELEGSIANGCEPGPSLSTLVRLREHARDTS